MNHANVIVDENSTLLSDVLIKTGMCANIKNNLSMSETCDVMLNICKNKVINGESVLRVKTAFMFAVDVLNAKGFKYYKKELFKI